MSHRFRTANRNSPAARARQADYNTRHYREAGARAVTQVQSGQARCWRCRTPIPRTARRGPDWQLGHDDWDRSIIRGPECSRCNRSAAGRKGNRVQRQTRQNKRRRPRVTPLTL